MRSAGSWPFVFGKAYRLRRAGGTGLSGGALAHRGGVVISFDRMNAIIDIDERNLQVTTEPGVITEVLQNAVREKDYFIRLIQAQGQLFYRWKYSREQWWTEGG